MMKLAKWTATIGTRVKPEELAKIERICESKEITIAELLREYIHKGLRHEVE